MPSPNDDAGIRGEVMLRVVNNDETGSLEDRHAGWLTAA